MENNGENSGPLTSLPVNRLMATDCNADTSANKGPPFPQSGWHHKWTAPKQKQRFFWYKSPVQFFSSWYTNTMEMEKWRHTIGSAPKNTLLVYYCWQQYTQPPYTTLCFTDILLFTSLLLVATTSAFFFVWNLFLFWKFTSVLKSCPASLNSPYSERKDWQEGSSGIC